MTELGEVGAASLIGLCRREERGPRTRRRTRQRAPSWSPPTAPRPRRPRATQPQPQPPSERPQRRLAPPRALPSPYGLVSIVVGCGGVGGVLCALVLCAPAVPVLPVHLVLMLGRVRRFRSVCPGR